MLHEKVIEAIGEKLGKFKAELGGRIEKIAEEIPSQIQEAVEPINGELSELKSDITGVIQRIDDLPEAVDGVDGEDGLPGEKGEKGDEGRQGPAGESITGPEGPSGRDGRDGLPGPQGERGERGQDGRPGVDVEAATITMDGPHDYVMTLYRNDGTEIKTPIKIPYPEHKGIYEEDQTYEQGQIVTKGSAMFQALVVTDNPPPGEDWGQILVAPRGKTGPQGKMGLQGLPGPQGEKGEQGERGSEGPRGKNGRNGVDASVDPEYLAELKAIAEQTKAFEDGRSDAHAITSYRGYFSDRETYRSGDVVNYNKGLWLCLAGGQYFDIARNPESWEKIYSSPSRSKNYMYWRGDWQVGSYGVGDTVRDGQYTMTCVAETEDRAGPVPVGSEGYLFEGTYAPQSPTVETVTFGTRHLNEALDIEMTGYKLQHVQDYFYRIYMVYDPDGAGVISELLSFTAPTTGETEFVIPALWLPQGVVVDLVATAAANELAPDTFVGNWNYITPNNTRTPLDGEIIHSSNQPTQFRVSVVDNDTGDRQADLATITTGDTISDGVQTWTVEAITDNTTWFEFIVSPAVLAFEGIKSFTFTRVTAQTTTYSRDDNYWAGSTLVKGIYAEDGVAYVQDDNAYGLEAKLQFYQLSDDWEVVGQIG